MAIRYLDWQERLEFEIIQRQEEGCLEGKAIEHWQKLLESIPKDGSESSQAEARKLLSKLKEIPEPPALELYEPDNYEGILAARPVEYGRLHSGSMDTDAYLDRVLGGWLGRSAGCLLGKPMEKFGRKNIRKVLESNNTWPLADYVTAEGIPGELLKQHPWNRHEGFESLRENIVCMTEDDDLNYTMLNLYVVEQYGLDFTTAQVGEAWLKLLPVLETFTAERVAYNNLLNGTAAEDAGITDNPFREWIGAQIRADFWGYISPGKPGKAAELAYRDARLSHSRNGIYGEMFFAALNAAAFIEKDPSRLVALGLEQLPENCRLSKSIAFAADLAGNESDWEKIVDTLNHEMGHYHWVHVINNAALVVAALVHGAGDFERTICNAAMAGWDTDCNGATAGSILGIVHGSSKLPGKWISPLNNEIRTSLRDFDHCTFTELARRTVAAGKSK